MTLKNSLKYGCFVLLLLCICYTVSKLPVQNLRITAVTEKDNQDLTGETKIRSLKPLQAGRTYTAVIRFRAVKNRSGDLFTTHGSGPYVHFGCNELKVEQQFVSFGRFLSIRLKMDASEADLKLEDGTPFDRTRYALRPILTIEE